MKSLTVIAAIACFGLTGVRAQNVSVETPEDPVQKAIREFNQRDRSKPNEVTVTLAPPLETPTNADGLSPATPDPSPAGEPADTETPTDGATDPQASGDEAATMEESTPEPNASTGRKGLAVRVEKLQTGSGSIDPGQVKLLAPFPAKPLARPPAGWRLESSENAPPFTREVELAPGKKITLTIRPHLLVPDADKSSVFSVPEPGFDPSLGYRQDATVGALLSRSVRQLDEDAKGLGAAIDGLQQLLVSLPKPAPPPAAPPTPAPESKPVRKK